MKAIEKIDGVNLNDDLRAMEHAMGMLEARIDVAHPMLNAAIYEAFITLDQAYQDMVERLAEATAAQVR